MMNDEEEIKKLQAELDALKHQFNENYRKIIELQNRLNGIAGTTNVVPPRSVQQRWSLENFIGLRLIHFIGIIVLVIGLSIGVKYAIDKELISETLRILLAYAAGVLLYLLSFRLRKKYKGFSAILFSGAMASLYFTSYGAHVYYNMISFGAAFAVMVALTVYTVYEAIRYDRQEIALLGLVGAYGIPFLISKNEDRADLLFLYVTIINLGVVFLAVRKLWRNVGITAQAITWVLMIGWASMRVAEGFKWTGFIFMCVFFLLFLFTILSFKIIQKERIGVQDGYQLVLNNVALYIAALFVFGISGLTGADLPAITLVVSLIAALQALLIYANWKDEIFTTRLLASLALTLFVMFIAFNWDGFTVTLLWLLTAVIMFVAGFRLRSVRTRMAAIILIAVTLGKLLVLDSLVFTTVQKVIAYLVLGVLLLVVSFFYQKFKQQLFNDKM